MMEMDRTVHVSPVVLGDLRDSLQVLIDAADHLLYHHDCDCDHHSEWRGYELVMRVLDKARRALESLKSEMVSTTTQDTVLLGTCGSVQQVLEVLLMAANHLLDDHALHPLGGCECHENIHIALSKGKIARESLIKEVRAQLK